MSVESYGDSGGGGAYIRHTRPAERTGQLDFRNMNDVQILAFMRSVLDDVGGQMNARAETLRRRNEEAAQLAEEIAVLQRLADLGEANGANENLRVNGSDLGGDTIEGRSVEEWMNEHHPGLYDRLNKEARADGRGQRITAGELQSQIKIRQNRQNELSTANEMDMIGFQSLVQTRQMFVNMATQMMKGDHETKSAIARNI